MEQSAINNRVAKFAIRRALRYLDADPDRNIPRLMTWVDRFDRRDVIAKQRDAVRAAIQNPDNNWYRLIRSLWTDIDPQVRRTLFENLIVNTTIIGGKKQEQLRETYGCNIPWAILMDPTSACNLHCVGCWAADYGNKLSMDYDMLAEIIRQGRELGVYLYIYSGGEPLVRKKDIIRLCEENPDCEFLAFTNATLIDEAFADEMLRVKNFVPAMSVEGFEDATDARRGAGTYQAVLRAMEILKRRKLLYGVSCCYTSMNAEVIGSEAYFDDLVDKGAKFAWLFTYIPVGKSAAKELIAKPQQRAFLYRQIRAFRSTKPIFTMDFWNDGEFVQGCIAGGRRYLHINANGDIEPCAFIHYADCNIHRNTLLEALQSPLFMQYHNNQPFNKNHLRPCPLLDNPGKLVEMVQRSGAQSTDFESREDVADLTAKCAEAAENWTPVADTLWEQSQKDRDVAYTKRSS